jgi:hypothetical protein
MQRGTSALGQDGDLLHPVAPRAEELEDRIPAEERADLVFRGHPRRDRARLGHD